jgi:secreted PhoX family phosphatase
VPESTPFNGGEGIWFHQGVVYFSTKGDNKVWAYHTENDQLRIIYDGQGGIDGVDNLTVSCCGDVLVAEDGGNMQIVAIAPNGELKPLVQIEGQDESEVTGPAFDPSGTRLYFSSQRGVAGTNGDGITYEVTGPFHRLV